ncbi:hypothetical protein LTR84_006396 [Exophiala bonariae]|uniref:Uncharacterized protein n=1 Tax=Exophiala bonariae TaxID=1690606 RepID=A0AAV9N154_9EURO|nr:hypothetical protein LTR84_006396 [Exophiala bonariae]
MTLRGYNQCSAVDVALAACILFASVEGLRGHIKTSLMHVYSGLRILEEEESKLSRIQSATSSRHLLRIVLQRLACRVSEVGHHEFIPEQQTSPNGNDTLSDAICEVIALQSQIQHLFRHQVLSLIPEPVPRGAGSTQVPISGILRHFKAVLEEIKAKYSNVLFLTSQEFKFSLENEAILRLNTMITSIEIIFNIHDSMNEQTQDALIERFREHGQWSQMYLKTFSKTKGITENSEIWSQGTATSQGRNTRGAGGTGEGCSQGFQDILPKPPPGLAPPLFMNPGVVPSLFMAAARCPDRSIREAAIKLLKTCDRSEGPWDSKIAADIGSKFTELENSTITDR